MAAALQGAVRVVTVQSLFRPADGAWRRGGSGWATSEEEHGRPSEAPRGRKSAGGRGRHPAGRGAPAVDEKGSGGGGGSLGRPKLGIEE